MFFLNPKIVGTREGLKSARGYTVEDDSGRRVVLWFDAGTPDFLRQVEPVVSIPEVSELTTQLRLTQQQALEQQQRQGILGSLGGGWGLGGLLGKKLQAS